MTVRGGGPKRENESTEGLWEGFVKEIAFELGVKERGVMDNESDESTEKEVVTNALSQRQGDWNEVDG